MGGLGSGSGGRSRSNLSDNDDRGSGSWWRNTSSDDLGVSVDLDLLRGSLDWSRGLGSHGDHDYISDNVGDDCLLVEELVHGSGSNQAGGREESEDGGRVHLDGRWWDVEMVNFFW